MKINKFISSFMALCLVGGAMPVMGTSLPETAIMAFAAEDYTKGTYESLTYKKYVDHVEITYCDRTVTEVVIPEEIEGVPVTSIGIRAFYECSSLTSVTIPEGVTSIGMGAFKQCQSLTSITIPEGVASIEDSAFYKCTSLTSIKIPESVTSIEDHAFFYCQNLTSITIPDTVTSIGDYVFTETLWLENKKAEDPLVIVNKILIDGTACSGDVIIPDDVTRIGGEAFQYCKTVTSITIPDSVTSIGEFAFDSCRSLISITIPDSITSIARYTFYGCDSLTSIIIPNSVTSIGERAFGFCDSLTSIIIPEGVTSINEGTFTDCTQLTEITIPDSVVSIGAAAFSDCMRLSSIALGNNITSIGVSAFRRCNDLTEISISENVKSIGYNAFLDTKWLQNKQEENPIVIVNGILINGQKCSGDVTIPNNVTRINDGSFENCENVTSIKIPVSVENIDLAFKCCTNLESITILNHECKICDQSNTICNKIGENYGSTFTGTIIGYEHSTARFYAEKYGYKFESLGEAPTAVYGDANDNGEIEVADAVFILQGLADPSNEEFKRSEQGEINADCHTPGNGVDSEDALAILKFKAMLIDELPYKN